MPLRQASQAPSRNLERDGERWKAILQSSTDAIVAIDPAGKITVFNPSAERIFGYTEAEVLGRPVDILMPEPYRSEHHDYIARYERTGEAKAIGRVRHVEAVRRSGKAFPIELSVSEVHLGEETTYVAIIRDVTDRTQLELEVRQQRDLAENLLSSAQVIVLVLAPDGSIVRYNPYMEKISEFPLAEVQGKDWFETFLPERDRSRIREVFTRALAGENIVGNVNPISTRSGGEREIEWNARLLRDANGDLIGVLCAGQDVTERKQAEVRLRLAEQAQQRQQRLADIGAITAKVVHDLGNPLAALTMQAQLIQRRAKRGEISPIGMVEKPVEQSLATLRRLRETILEFNDFARGQRLKPEPIPLAVFLESVVALWQPMASERGVVISLQGSDRSLTLRADQDKLSRVLDNLVKNALEAIGEGPGDIAITASLSLPDTARISVEDSGCGVPEDVDIFRLFESTKPEGTGLGLAVAKQIVEAHGGSIQYTPRAGGGTTFTIELPADGPPSAGGESRVW